MKLSKEVILQIDQLKSEYQDLERRYDNLVTRIGLSDKERDKVIDYIFNNFGSLEEK